MAEIRETAWNHLGGEHTGTFFTAESKWINAIMEWSEQYPDEVDIRHINDDGSMVVHLPITWFKVRPPKKMTEEHKAKVSAALDAYRASK